MTLITSTLDLHRMLPDLRRLRNSATIWREAFLHRAMHAFDWIYSSRTLVIFSSFQLLASGTHSFAFVIHWRIDIRTLYSLFLFLGIGIEYFLFLWSLLSIEREDDWYSKKTELKSNYRRMKYGCQDQFSNELISSVTETVRNRYALIECKWNPWAVTWRPHSALFEGRGGEGRGKERVSQKMRHCYSSLQLTYTFKTRTKHKKLWRLALCCVYVNVNWYFLMEPSRKSHAI